MRLFKGHLGHSRAAALLWWPSNLDTRGGSSEQRPYGPFGLHLARDTFDWLWSSGGRGGGGRFHLVVSPEAANYVVFQSNGVPDSALGRTESDIPGGRVVESTRVAGRLELGQSGGRASTLRLELICVV